MPDEFLPVQAAGEIVEESQPALLETVTESARGQQLDGRETFVFSEESRVSPTDVAISPRGGQVLRKIEIGMTFVRIPEIWSGQKNHSQRSQGAAQFPEKVKLPRSAAHQVLDHVKGEYIVENLVLKRQPGTVALDIAAVRARVREL